MSGVCGFSTDLVGQGLRVTVPPEASVITRSRSSKQNALATDVIVRRSCCKGPAIFG